MTSSDSIVLAVVPLRLASLRIPKKVLADIGGTILAARTLRKAQEACNALPGARLIAAVDSEQTKAALERAVPGVEVILTDPALPSGTDRVFAAAKRWLDMNPGARERVRGVLNIQGDMPFAGMSGIRESARYFLTASDADLAKFPMMTLAEPWPKATPLSDLGAVKVLSDKWGRALYFSRHAIPYTREVPSKKQWADAEFRPACDLHIGLYGYTLETLAKLSAHAPVPMEKGESLEQLRALWLGIPILVMQTTCAAGESFRGIDTPKDLTWARKFAKPVVKKKSAAKAKSATKAKGKKRK